MRIPKPPKHLSKASKKFWKQITGQYILEAHHQQLLLSMCECLDYIQEARQKIQKDGPYFKDRWDQIKAHPAQKCERDNKVLFQRLLKELGLDLNEVPELPKMKRIY